MDNFISKYSESELLVKASLGDQKSFEILLLQYYKPLGTYVLNVTEDYDETQDIIQEVFLKLWVNKNMLSEISNFKNYLFIATKNRVLNVLKERSKKLSLFSSLEHYADINTIPEEMDESSKIRESALSLVEKEIDKLPLQQRSVFVLTKIQRLNYAQVSEKLNISIETVRKHAYLAQRSLRMQLKGK